MGALSRDGDLEGIELPARSIVGRTPLAGLRLEHSSVSREHAVIEWHRGRWRVRDLGSRNGTTINGEVCSDSFHELAEGDVLVFGDGDERWTLIDDAPPPPAAVAEDGTLRMGEGQVLLLPSREEPALAIEATTEGWVCDDGEAVRQVDGGETVEAGGRRWSLMLPVSSGDPTTLVAATAPHIEELTAIFELDRTEEHIRLVFEHEAGRLEMTPRAHDDLLLHLARERLRDVNERGLSDPEAGWIDSVELGERLGLSPERLNVHVFRARQALATNGVVEAGRIVERRSRARRVRFGVPAIRIERP